jgi:hypothetical protein
LGLFAKPADRPDEEFYRTIMSPLPRKMARGNDDLERFAGIVTDSESASIGNDWRQAQSNRRFILQNALIRIFTHGYSGVQKEPVLPNFLRDASISGAYSGMRER